MPTTQSRIRQQVFSPVPQQQSIDNHVSVGYISAVQSLSKVNGPISEADFKARYLKDLCQTGRKIKPRIPKSSATRGIEQPTSTSTLSHRPSPTKRTNAKGTRSQVESMRRESISTSHTGVLASSGLRTSPVSVPTEASQARSSSSPSVRTSPLATTTAFTSPLGSVKEAESLDKKRVDDAGKSPETAIHLDAPDHRPAAPVFGRRNMASSSSPGSRSNDAGAEAYYRRRLATLPMGLPLRNIEELAEIFGVPAHRKMYNPSPIAVRVAPAWMLAGEF
ncbi:hypothetical protein FRB96_005752 [Tulasnella sp. 330]|nr:hypothetical protein FRB96_005752 [Tulasnella sp. 330]KAG8881155.1 hypothetical protein FRB97_009851 [Tulasnella sp. 331]